LTESEPSERRKPRALPIPPAVGCLGSILAGLAGVAIFFVVVSMALRGEVRFTRGTLGETRIWPVEEGDELGLGFSTAEIVRGSEESGAACVETRIRFVMLRSTEDRRPITYCECFQQEDGSWSSTGDCER
jgi:hypothetical protein